jgi:hypothetical protein
MLNSRAFVLAISLAGILPVAAMACTADQLKGNWQCEGGAKDCSRGFDISHGTQTADGNWRWTDGAGNLGPVDVKDQDVTVHYTTGGLANTSVTGKLDAACHRIVWSGTHYDRKL